MLKRIIGCIAIGGLLLVSCQNEKRQLTRLAGYAQGTTYHISYIYKESKSFQSEVDSLLDQIDLAMSTYDKTSEIVAFNKADSVMAIGPYFQEVVKRSLEISKETQGNFDITVGPLVSTWGFGANPQLKGQEKPEDILERVGYQKIQLIGNQLSKQRSDVQLDVNAIAQGYSVDVLADFLEAKGIQDYMVEVGGELRCKGTNADGNTWRIGIDKPSENAKETQLQAVVAVDNSGLATSGNYRKFYVDDNGMKYVHTIDPHTGYPAKRKLLSTTVMTKDAMSADAYATAFMVMGLEKTKAFLASHPEIDVYLVYVDKKGDWATYATPGFEKQIQN